MHQEGSKSTSINSNGAQLLLKEAVNSNCKALSTKCSSSQEALVKHVSSSIETLEDMVMPESVKRKICPRKENKILADERDMLKELHQQQHSTDSYVGEGQESAQKSWKESDIWRPIDAPLRKALSSRSNGSVKCGHGGELKAYTRVRRYTGGDMILTQ